MASFEANSSLQRIRSLAHNLYCQSQRQLNASRPISRSLRTLRNRLEEADELLVEGTCRPGDVEVLNAASASKDVLDRLGLTLKDHQSVLMKEDAVDESFIIEYLEQIDAVTSRLTNATNALEGRVGTLDLILDNSLRPRTISPGLPSSVSSISGDDWRRASTVSRTCSPDHNEDRMRREATSPAIRIRRSPQIEVLTPYGTLVSPSGTSRVVEQAFSPFCDPLSLDIDQASHMILEQEAGAKKRLDVKRDSSISTNRVDVVVENELYDAESTTFEQLSVDPVPTPPPQRHGPSPQSRYRVVNADPFSTPNEERQGGGPVDRVPYVTREYDHTSGQSASNQEHGQAVNIDSVHTNNSDGHVSILVGDDPAMIWGIASPGRMTPGNMPVSNVSGYRTNGFEDATQQRDIIYKWNNCLWEEAQVLLEAHLLRQIKLREYLLSRRLRFLLGVLHSLKGEWASAVSRLLSVFSIPITGAAQLDAGDYAAGYWLGDAYVLLNRKPEALLAYCIAERSPLFQAAIGSYQLIRFEQEACRTNMGTSTLLQGTVAADSILNATHTTPEAIGELFGYVRWQPTAQFRAYVADPNASRFVALRRLGMCFELKSENEGLRIDHSAFNVRKPWPLPFDPYFNIANISHCDHECDLIQTLAAGLKLKIPRTSGISRGRSDHFSHVDLVWLIVTIRECLTWLEIKWSESNTCKFSARYTATLDGDVSTLFFFDISISKLTFRTGYGVEICPGGVSSARIVGSNTERFNQGAHLSETERVRAEIRQFLEGAAKRHEVREKRTMARGDGVVFCDTSPRGPSMRYA